MEKLKLNLTKSESSDECQDMRTTLKAMGPEAFIIKMFDSGYIDTLLKLNSFFNKLSKSTTSYTVFDVNELFNEYIIGIPMSTPRIYERLDSAINQLFDTNITSTKICYKSKELDLEIKLDHHRYDKNKTTEYITYKYTYGEVMEYIIIKSAYLLDFIKYIKSNL